jgi:hypothetical protein
MSVCSSFFHHSPSHWTVECHVIHILFTDLCQLSLETPSQTQPGHLPGQPSWPITNWDCHFPSCWLESLRKPASQDSSAEGQTWGKKAQSSGGLRFRVLALPGHQHCWPPFHRTCPNPGPHLHLERSQPRPNGVLLTLALLTKNENSSTVKTKCKEVLQSYDLHVTTTPAF